MPLADISDDEEEVGRRNTYSPFGLPVRFTPVNVPAHNASSIFCVPPFFGPLLFDNTDSDARDHCANERTFLSYLRLSVYMAIVSIAIVVSFHLKSQPSRLELRMAKPLGIIFWLLSLSCLALGFGNYIKTVNKYSKRAAIVQTGWKTQSVLTVIAFSIVGVCVLFLATNSKRI
ncbi:hypothetical protein ONS95_011155 [Cadophora gregata]|uniref:uncharacterized protein n=1 Tax=Cadophora gregata TaxID=51156 RepID=UPI0026DB189D|nr:uncharacterized protein ONS95_011155 [Cadophora gregata]KAK0119719.1 hypothetical protein ONS95_011155 [Cadophora gregata]KAK0120754.1 hypothetical protein ONS96_010956 [Cadophora gregata f. sp. sojae]